MPLLTRVRAAQICHLMAGRGRENRPMLHFPELPQSLPVLPQRPGSVRRGVPKRLAKQLERESLRERNSRRKYSPAPAGYSLVKAPRCRPGRHPWVIFWPMRGNVMGRSQTYLVDNDQACARTVQALLSFQSRELRISLPLQSVRGQRRAGSASGRGRYSLDTRHSLLG